MLNPEMEPGYDGITELWWDSMGDMLEGASRPAGIAAAERLIWNENKLIDLKKVVHPKGRLFWLSTLFPSLALSILSHCGQLSEPGSQSDDEKCPGDIPALPFSLDPKAIKVRSLSGRHQVTNSSIEFSLFQVLEGPVQCINQFNNF